MALLCPLISKDKQGNRTAIARHSADISNSSTKNLGPCSCMGMGKSLKNMLWLNSCPGETSLEPIRPVKMKGGGGGALIGGR